MKKFIMNNLFMVSVSTMIVLGILLILIKWQIESNFVYSQEEIEQSEKELQALKKEADEAILNLRGLEIQDGYEVTIDGSYIYHSGRVKNIGTQTIQYYELVVEYLDDEGNILASEMTNNSVPLKPDAMQEFKVMRFNQPEYKKSRIYVLEIKH